MALTERQQQVQDLKKEGRSPDEIAKTLGISTNAVYQQLRRMRNNKPTRRNDKPTRRQQPGRRTPGRLRISEEVIVPSLGNQVEVHTATPLQALRARRNAIEGEVKNAKAVMEAARMQLRRETEAHDRLVAKHGEEIKRLQGAEAALTGKKVVKAKRQRQSARKAQAPVVATDGATQSTDPGALAEGSQNGSDVEVPTASA